MAKKNSFIVQMQTATRLARKQAALVSRMQTLDKVTITLGQLGFTPDQLAEFEDEFVKVEDEYCTSIVDDAKDDKEIWYSKDRVDRALKQYVRPDRYADHETRYAHCYAQNLGGKK